MKKEREAEGLTDSVKEEKRPRDTKQRWTEMVRDEDKVEKNNRLGEGKRKR